MRERQRGKLVKHVTTKYLLFCLNTNIKNLTHHGAALKAFSYIDFHCIMKKSVFTNIFSLIVYKVNTGHSLACIGISFITNQIQKFNNLHY